MYSRAVSDNTKLQQNTLIIMIDLSSLLRWIWFSYNFYL